LNDKRVCWRQRSGIALEAHNGTGPTRIGVAYILHPAGKWMATGAGAKRRQCRSAGRPPAMHDVVEDSEITPRRVWDARGMPGGLFCAMVGAMTHPDDEGPMDSYLSRVAGDAGERC